MALLSNINNLFSVDSTGEIKFNDNAGTSGYVLVSAGTGAPPVWTDRDTGGVRGTGTENKVVRWNVATATGVPQTIGDGPITFSGSAATATSTFGGHVGIGVAAHGTASLNITNANQHIRLNNGSELGIINLDADGKLDLWAHGTDETINFRTGTGSGTVTMSVVGEKVGIGTELPDDLLTLSSSTCSYTTAPILRFDSTCTDSDNIRNWAIGPADSSYGNFHIFKSAARGGDPVNTAGIVATINYLGNVGIGTTSPNTKLTVQSGSYSFPSGIDNNSFFTIAQNSWSGMTLLASTTTGSFIDFGDTDAGWRGRILYAHNGDYMYFSTAATERMRITSDGNVTFVKGSDTNRDANSIKHASNDFLYMRGGAAGIVISDDGEDTRMIMSNNGNIRFDAGTKDNAMTIEGSTGNVGIGVTGPGVQLEVGKSATIGAESVSTSTTNHENVLKVKGKNNYSDGTTWYGDYGQILLSADSNMTGSAHQFLITNALDNNKFAIVRSVDANTVPVVSSTANGVNSGTADFVIDGAGNVGIGTDSPSSYYANQLVVKCSSTENGISIIANGTSDSNYLMFGDGTSGPQRYEGYIEFNHSTNLMSYRSSGEMRFLADSAEKMRITSSGLTIFKSSFVASTAYGGELNIGGSSVTTFGLQAKYNQAGATQSTLYSSPGYTSNDQLFLLGAGAGNTSQLVLRGNGNVGIGTTTFAPTISNQIKLGNMGSGVVGEVFDANVVDGAARMIICAGGNTGQVPILSLRHYSAAYGIDLWMGYNSPWDTYIDNRQANSGFIFRNNCNADGSEVILMDLDGNSGAGTLTVKGDIVAYGSPSDKRLKENIKPIKSALDKVIKLQGVTFDWKEKGITNLKEDIGFIAQDVQKVVPELVRENEDGMLSMRHQGIAPILLEAIKELKAEIEELKSNKCNCNK